MARWGDPGEDRHRMWSLPVLRRYWAMQLPGVVIVLLVASFLAADLGWSHNVAWMAVAAWIAELEAIAHDPMIAPLAKDLSGELHALLPKTEPS